MNKKLLLIINMLLIQLVSMSQPCSSNAGLGEDPCAPIPLTVNATCSFQEARTNGCGNFFNPSTCGGQNRADVWGVFTIGVAHNLTIRHNSSNRNMTVHLYTISGACGNSGNLTEVSCSNTNGGTGNENLTASSLPAGTYYVRAQAINANGLNGNGFCVFGAPSGGGIGGDDCSTAIDLASLVSPISGTTVGANNDFSFCNMGSAPDLIAYYDLPAHSILTINQTVNGYDSRHSLRYGGACPGTTEIVCTDDSDLKVETWQNCTGSTQRVYWIQSGFSSNSGTFTLSWNVVAGTCPIPPPNDECAGAIAVTLGTTLNTTINAPGIGATNSGITSCVGSEDDDVWYSFTAPSSGSVNIALSNATGTTNLTHEVFSGNCGSLTSVNCSDPNTSLTGGLTVGATYFVRVYTYSSTGNNTGFDIDITAGPTAGVSCYTQSNPSWSALVNGTFSVIPDDDEFGPARGILFDFCFMGNLFTQMYVSSNGYISFDAANVNGTSEWETETLPSTHTELLNSIMSPHHDLDANYGGDIRKRNVGVAPNRSVEIIYNNVGYFDDIDCPGVTARHQIILYETSNVIDIKIESKPVCTNWNNGDATMGLNGPLGLASVNVAGRNDQNWTANNEVTRFIPSCDVCPIGLGSVFSYFDVQNKGGVNEIMFATSSEENMNYFEVQRSFDAVNYETIKTLKSVYGNSTNETAYSFIDKKPVTGVNYYRVKSIDVDNEFSFTQMKSVKIELVDKPKIYPNPSTDVVYVEYFNVINNDVVFELMNISGQTVMVKTISNSKGFNKSMIDVNTLEKGVYFYKMFINNSIETGKLIVK